MLQLTNSLVPTRHLTDHANRLLAGPESARRNYFAPDRYFVGYDEAVQVHADMERTLRQPVSRRPRCGLIRGISTNGKTSILTCFAARYPRNDNVEGDAADIPVLLLDAPFDGKLGTLFRDMLDALGAPENFPSANAPNLAYAKAVSRLLKACNVRLIIIDEIHSLATVNDGTVYTKQTLKYIKSIPNTLHIPLILVGEPEAKAIGKDKQLANRFWTSTLPQWKNDKRTGRYLADLEANLPLAKPSNLTDAENGIANFLIAKSGNALGNMMELINAVAYDAVGGEERITLSALERAVQSGIRQRLQDVA